jgi:hypothetical protein
MAGAKDTSLAIADSTPFIVAIEKVSTLSALHQHHKNLPFA